MHREYLLYSLILLLTLGATYVSSISDKTVGKRATITVFRVSPDKVKSGHYRSSQLDVDLKRLTDGRLLVDQRLKIPRQEELQFLANESFVEVFNNFAPLAAHRALGKATDIDLETYGLKQDVGRFELHHQDGQRTSFKVGNKSYGTSDFYVQYGEQVYLVAGHSIDKVIRAKHLLFEERFMALTFSDGLTMVLQIAGNTLKAVLEGTLPEIRRHAPQQESGKWLVDGQEHQQLANWLRRLRSLPVQSYRQKLTDETVVMTIVLQHDNDELERLQFYRLADGAYLVASKFLGTIYGQLSTTRMKQLQQDLHSLFVK